MNLPLLALAVAAFGIGTTEFVIMGLLPEVAADLGVTIPSAGLLITGYALGVVVGGPALVVATGRLSRKAALLVLMAVFLAGNLLCAIAPSYGLLMAARVIAALCHGAFFGIGAVVAASLVAPNRRAQAVALMFAGLTIANVTGVPAGTALGQAFGWRWTFAAVAAIGLAAVAAIRFGVPDRIAVPAASLRHEIGVLAKPQVLLAMAMSGLMSGSLFAVFTYISPILREITGLSLPAVTWVLLIFGVGATVGGLGGGRLADWKLMPAIIGLFGGLAAVFLALAFSLASPAVLVPVIFLWGIVTFAIGSPLQIRVVNTASEGPNLASTINQSAFNLGNAAGAWLGAAALSLGFGYAALPWLGLAMAMAGGGLALLSAWLERRRALPVARSAAA